MFSSTHHILHIIFPKSIFISIQHNQTRKTDMIDVLRLPEIAFVGVMPEVLALTDGVVSAVMKIVQLIRTHK